MALQLTMHRLTGSIVPTYESASTRRWGKLLKEGKDWDLYVERALVYCFNGGLRLGVHFDSVKV